MHSNKIRQKFLDFFKSKGHKIVSSAPIVIKDDPTLMFTNAGMNQFKDYFLGNKLPQDNRIVNTQKCLRVSGKHNDLEQVGYDTYHHTMFEMLGNWSFGDPNADDGIGTGYFKKEAIEWAWELLTQHYGLSESRLYVTVFEGDKNEGLASDKESYDIWKEIVDESRILKCSKKDNFWEMGDTGPCGPCSEIHIDLRPDKELKEIPAVDLINNDHPLIIEIWNLVFIEFNRSDDGSLKTLPAKHVDTGLGFERLVMAIQGKKSNYDTDIFQTLIQFISKQSGKKYENNVKNRNPQSVILNRKSKIGPTPDRRVVNRKSDVSMRVIADHVRAITFAIADGQIPSNNKAGYVIRRILRRAVRYAFTFLDFKQPFIYKLVPVVADQFGNVFPEVKSQQEIIQKVIREEESSFLKTLENGLKKLDQIVTQDLSRIDGKTAFELYDTYGFPLDLTKLIAREHGLEIDEKGFQKEMNAQKNRSKSAAEIDTEDWVLVDPENTGIEDVKFVGYDCIEAETKIIKYRKIKSKNKSQFHIVLDKTPFYAEGGGQVGDTGYIEAIPHLTKQVSDKIYIKDTKKENELIIHITEKLPVDIKATFKAVVDSTRCLLTQNNHSATHLLHAALKRILGEHIQQRGSLVNPDHLRFDFSHFTKVTTDELKQIEMHVNKKIRENIALDEKREFSFKKAKAMGATALFGEKYGDRVRVIIFDRDYSVELCGGKHVSATGQIGIFKIISESSVAAGVRRIEAITADKAEQYINEQFEILDKLKEELKNPKDINQAVHTLIETSYELKKQVEGFQFQQVNQIKQELIDSIEHLEGISYIAKKVKLPSNDALKQLAFDLKRKVGNLFLVLASEINNKPQIVVMISDDLVKQKGYHAGNIVKELSKEIVGGGGGQPFFATAGGKDLSGLDNVIQKARNYL